MRPSTQQQRAAATYVQSAELLMKRFGEYCDAHDTESLDRNPKDLEEAFYRYNAVRLGLVRTA